MYPPPPPYEYHPVQPAQSPWQRFLNLGCIKQSLVGCLSLFILCIGALCVLATPAFMQGVHNGEATQTAVARGVTPAPSPTSSSQTANPHLGGTLDDFVATYGAPVQTAPNYEVFSISTARITAYINPSDLPNAQTVNRVAVTGPSTWRPQDTAANCAVFLPDDAVRYDGGIDAGYIDYHSSLGEIVLQVDTQNCLLFVSPS